MTAQRNAVTTRASKALGTMRFHWSRSAIFGTLSSSVSDTVV